MRLIVNIDDILYKTIKNNGYIYEEEVEEVALSIIGGIPLPIGHGRIGDLDALEQEMINGIKAGNYENGYEDYSNINSVDDCVELVRFADTIIEADKESKVIE